MRTRNATLATSSQLGLQLWLLCLLPKFCFLPGTEREGENLPLEYSNLFCCHAVKSVVFFDDITVSLKMDYCCVKSFKSF